MIDTLTELSASLVTWLLSASWQAAVLIVVVAALERCLGDRSSPQLRYGLWTLVGVKLLLPPSLPALWSPPALLWSPLAARLPVLLPSADPLAETPAAAMGAGLSTILAVTPSLTAGLALVWATGAIAYGTLIRRRNRGLRQSLLQSATPCCEPVRAAAGRAAQALSLKSLPRLHLSPAAHSPLVLGCLRPTVILPADATSRWTPEELEHVLCHELAHVRRRDLWAEAAFAVVATLYWFHPLVGWARRRTALSRELCCDATALAAMGPRYRRTLTRVAAETLLVPAGAGAVGMAGSRSAMMARLRQLARHQTPSRGRRLRCAAALAAFALLALPMSHGSDAPSDEDAEIAVARHALEQVLRGEPGWGSLHARYAALRLNALQDGDSVNDH